MMGIAGVHTPAPDRPYKTNPITIIGIVSGILSSSLGPSIKIAIGEIMRAIRMHFKGLNIEQSQPTMGHAIP